MGLHVIDEGPQLRQHLIAAGITEEHARHVRREALQDVDELARRHQSGDHRLGQFLFRMLIQQPLVAASRKTSAKAMVASVK